MKQMHILSSGFGIGLSWGVADYVLPGDAYVDMVETGNYYDDDQDIVIEG